jgi:hypothetical protein
MTQQYPKDDHEHPDSVRFDPSADHIVYFDPGEIVLLAIANPENPSEPINLQSLARELDLESDIWFEGGSPQEPVLFSRGPNEQLILQAARTRSWQEHGRAHEGPESRSISDVIDISSRMNSAIRAKGKRIDPAVVNKRGREENLQAVEIGNHAIIATAPNWFAGAADCSFGGGGCPDGQPRPTNVDPGWETGVFDALLKQALGRPKTGTNGAGVIVAIFDTWPEHREFENGRTRAASENPQITYYREFLPLQQHAKTVAIDCDGNVQDAYRMDDHGLFVSDVVRQLAPRAEIWVYRVLDDYGHGNLIRVAEAIQDAINRREQDGRPMILNLSLGFGGPMEIIEELEKQAQPGGPPEGALKAFSNPSAWTKDTLAIQRGLNGDTAAAFRGLSSDKLAALRLFFNFRRVTSVLAVAASGNDSCRPTIIAGPKLPAVAEGVLGIGSYLKAGTQSTFSNDDDLEDPDDGVGAFGEDVVGPYTRSKYPDGTSNTSGLAMWSGTSFATPVSSALAACLISEKAHLGRVWNPTSLIREIVFYPGGTARRAHLNIKQKT